MIHHHLDKDSNEHYAVSVTSDYTHVLIQLQDAEAYQIRLKLTKEQAEHIIRLLTESISKLSTGEGL